MPKSVGAVPGDTDTGGAGTGLRDVWRLQRVSLAGPCPPVHAPPSVIERVPADFEDATFFTPTHRTLLPDPDLFESQLCATEITVVLGPSAAPSSSSSSSPLSKAPLLNVYQAGAPLEDPRKVVKQCIAMARRRAEQLRESV